VDLSVANVDEALRRFNAAGGETLTGPFDIPIGRCAVGRDPFGNAIVMLDQTKGRYVTDADRKVAGVEKL
jgi:lactoylglutathione lyase